MKIVIDISEEQYKRICDHTDRVYDMVSLLTIVENGTPLQKGNWILQSNGECKLPAVRFKCSNCGKISFEESNYCPRCGAKMDGEETESD